jgi:guanylate kinase
MSECGNLYVLSAPSGTGKTTLVKALTSAMPSVTVSVSHTTRLPRPGETDGVNYYFTDENKFRSMIEQNEFLEHATVFGHLYGTSHIWVETALNRGMDVILEIDWQGCQQIQRLFPNSTSIFILPPSLSVLSQRLTQRNPEKPDVIQKRLADTREAVSHISDYDYLVINDDFQAAVNDLTIIIHAGRLKQPLQTKKFARLLAELQNKN